MIQLYQKTLKIETIGKKALYSITDQVQAVVTECGFKAGLCSLFLQHTSASLLIQENDAVPDIEAFFSQLVPELADYLLKGEGPDDMPSHIRAALTQSSEQIPIAEGKLLLSKLQDIYLWEQRQDPHVRSLVVTVMGE